MGNLFQSKKDRPSLHRAASALVKTCSNAHNSSLRSKFRTVVKNVQKAVAAGDGAKAADLYKTAHKRIDSIAYKGLFHKNKAARHKSRLAA